MACCGMGRVGGLYCMVGPVLRDSTAKLEYPK